MTESLRVESIIVGSFQTNCYLVGNGKKGVIIDPGDDFPKIKNLIEKYNIEIKKIILTHGHIDHIAAVSQVKDFTQAPVLIHAADADMLTSAEANLSASTENAFVAGKADELVSEGDIIEAGGLSFRVLHTPGHTPGGISLVTRGEEMVFTGDALFWGSIGRTDLPGGNHEVLMDSIRTKLLGLPDNTIVYPGHGPETTIGHERIINPFLIG